MTSRLGSLVLNTTLVGAMAFVIAGCDRPQEATGMPAPSTTVGTEIDDSVLTARIKAALLADPDIKSFDFKIETRKGEVQLSGFVDSQAQVERATSVARWVPGVKSVQNNVSMKGAATTVGNEVDDGVLTTKVKTALLADANISSFDIAVATRKGEVQLSGFVDSLSQVERAMEVARGIEGVRSVSNEMSVKK